MLYILCLRTRQPFLLKFLIRKWYWCLLWMLLFTATRMVLFLDSVCWHSKEVHIYILISMHISVNVSIVWRSVSLLSYTELIPMSVILIITTWINLASSFCVSVNSHSTSKTPGSYQLPSAIYTMFSELLIQTSLNTRLLCSSFCL